MTVVYHPRVVLPLSVSMQQHTQAAPCSMYFYEQICSDGRVLKALCRDSMNLIRQAPFGIHLNLKSRTPCN